MNHADITLPPRIAALPKDKRGYPVPYIVYVYEDGRPEFAVNDIEITRKAIKENRCHVCGQENDPEPWFVGGPGSVFLNGDRAVFRDGAMHQECMTFALEVCPHLLGQLKKPVALEPIVERLESEGKAAVDPTVIPGVPPIFVAVQAWRVEIDWSGPYHFVFKPFRKTQYWQNGTMLDVREGERQAKRHARELAKGGR